MLGTSRVMAISIAALLFLLGCTGVSEGDKCVGQTDITINGVTKVCVNGTLTGSCTVKGQVYSESTDSRIVCEGGVWVSKDKESGSQPAGTEGPGTGQAAEAEEKCAGKAFATANGVTSACVGGVWTTECASEGEVYTVSEAFQTKVVCKGGIWVEEELAPGENVTIAPEEPSVGEEPCMGTSWESSDNITKACVGGVWTTECASEGEVYDVSDFLETKIVCEGGVWVSKDLG
ncbi:MAG: hypothetical protein AB1529_05560 [Candidatus Micrarchaeota archaeon]